MFVSVKNVGTAMALIFYTLSEDAFYLYQGVPVAQWVKRWPTDLMVLGSSPV